MSDVHAKTGYWYPISEGEADALEELDDLSFRTYHALRRRVDWETMQLKGKDNSWAALLKAVTPGRRQGLEIKKPTLAKVRGAIKRLVTDGLVIKLNKDKDEYLSLILPRATHVGQNKPNRKLTGKITENLTGNLTGTEASKSVDLYEDLRGVLLELNREVNIEANIEVFEKLTCNEDININTKINKQNAGVHACALIGANEKVLDVRDSETESTAQNDEHRETGAKTPARFRQGTYVADESDTVRSTAGDRFPHTGSGAIDSPGKSTGLSLVSGSGMLRELNGVEGVGLDPRIVELRNHFGRDRAKMGRPNSLGKRTGAAAILYGGADEYFRSWLSCGLTVAEIVRICDDNDKIAQRNWYTVSFYDVPVTERIADKKNPHVASKATAGNGFVQSSQTSVRGKYERKVNKYQSRFSQAGNDSENF